LNYLRENKANSELLKEDEIIKNIIGNDKEDEVEDLSSVLEFIWHKDSFKTTIICIIFFTIKEHHTITSYFTKKS